MSRRSNYRKKKLIFVFIEYGIQLWLVIFITNIAVFYGFSFFSRASNNKLPTSIQPSPTVYISTPTFTPTPTASGPVVSLNFNMPGISSIGGNIKPAHPVRDVALYLYDPDANTADITVKPIYTIKTKATYDNDPNSQTYTSFVNPYIDLGADVKEGVYQIAFKTHQALIEVIKDPNSKSVGGKKFQVIKSYPLVLPPESMTSGDIYPLPDSDNLMDINDYNMLVNCFGEKAYGKSCISGSTSDLDDNGVIDGIDYNIMLLSFIKLKERGFNVPEIAAQQPPVIKPIFSNPVSTPTPIKPGPTKAKSNSSSAGGIILFIFFLLFGGVGAFIAFKKHKLDAILNKLPGKPFSSQPQSTMPDSPTIIYPTTTPNISNETVEKSGFLKKVKADAEKNGTWVTLADDAGINQGFYQGMNVTDGFVKIKGTMQNDEENKPYILITEITPEG